MQTKKTQPAWLIFAIPKRKDDTSQAIEAHQRFVKLLKIILNTTKMVLDPYPRSR